MVPQPQGVIPHLVVSNASAALEFYKKAFGATELFKVPADDGRRVLHAELSVNGAKVYVRDHFPEFCAGAAGAVTVSDKPLVQAPPTEIGGTAVTLHLDVPDCDAAVRRAVDAGARVTMPPEDAFWGARYAQIVDPFGHSWSMAHPLPGQQG